MMERLKAWCARHPRLAFWLVNAGLAWLAIALVLGAGFPALYVLAAIVVLMLPIVFVADQWLFPLARPARG